MATFNKSLLVGLLLFATAAVLASRTQAAVEVCAFPGAEGAGSTATGGRGSAVFYVSNLNDRGPGSLRDALSKSNRMIHFQVSGTIRLKRDLELTASNITLAGQTAPGDGVCLRGSSLIIRGDNVIVRFLRMRPGDEQKRDLDALTVQGADKVMVDHCSMSWSTDSINDVVRESTNVTIQWCILSEPLNQSVHHKGAHGYGTGWGSGAASGNSFHHNLLAHCNSRSPRLGSERHALVDVRNNVIYNTGSGWAYGGEHARVNYVGNYFRPGPDTTHPSSIFRVGSPATRMYLEGNVVDGAPAVTHHNARGMVVDEGISREETIVRDAYKMPLVTTSTAEQAYEMVLQHAGAVLPSRDAVDRRIVSDVMNRTGRIIDSQWEMGGWPELEQKPPLADTDCDGLPDAWEESHGLQAEDASDAQYIVSNGYSNVEIYLNEIAAVGYPKSLLIQRDNPPVE